MKPLRYKGRLARTNGLSSFICHHSCRYTDHTDKRITTNISRRQPRLFEKTGAQKPRGVWKRPGGQIRGIFSRQHDPAHPRHHRSPRAEEIVLLVSNLKTRRLTTLIRDTFDELQRAAEISGRYFCRLVFSTWDIPLQKKKKMLSSWPEITLLPNTSGCSPIIWRTGGYGSPRATRPMV